ncbi:MAG: hypothetical protein JW934_05610 [Anaerolineae bacterium]|nr:hypothetical protein [Anaerolineae bacterium]
MNSYDALDDLKAIREIMNRTRRTESGEGGWFMILWGIIWLLGFSASQFLPETISGWGWVVLNTTGITLTIWLAIRMGRGNVKSPTWRPIFFWWTSLALFDVLLIWLFDLRAGQDIILLMVLTIALGYVQFGLFSHWMISVIGILIAALAVGAALLIPDYFFVAMGLIGGGLLAGSGLWFVRQRK